MNKDINVLIEDVNLSQIVSKYNEILYNYQKLIRRDDIKLSSITANALTNKCFYFNSSLKEHMVFNKNVEYMIIDDFIRIKACKADIIYSIIGVYESTARIKIFRSRGIYYNIDHAFAVNRYEVNTNKYKDFIITSNILRLNNNDLRLYYFVQPDEFKALIKNEAEFLKATLTHLQLTPKFINVLPLVVECRVSSHVYFTIRYIDLPKKEISIEFTILDSDRNNIAFIRDTYANDLVNTLFFMVNHSIEYLSSDKCTFNNRIKSDSILKLMVYKEIFKDGG